MAHGLAHPLCRVQRRVQLRAREDVADARDGLGDFCEDLFVVYDGLGDTGSKQDQQVVCLIQEWTRDLGRCLDLQ